MRRFPAPGWCAFGDGFCHYPCDRLSSPHTSLALPLDTLARNLGLHRRSLNRYRHGYQKPPRSFCISLAAMHGYGFMPGWEGWYYSATEQKLYPPGFGRHGISQGDVIVSAMMRRLIPVDYAWLTGVRQPARYLQATQRHVIRTNMGVL